jgi:transcriptional/translational regulatory protein YebC/TACO1
MVPQNYVSLDAEAARKMRLIIDNLEDNDDVSEVWHNWDEEGEE